MGYFADSPFEGKRASVKNGQPQNCAVTQWAAQDEVECCLFTKSKKISTEIQAAQEFSLVPQSVMDKMDRIYARHPNGAGGSVVCEQQPGVIGLLCSELVRR
jgi:hypothetical protein